MNTISPKKKIFFAAAVAAFLVPALFSCSTQRKLSYITENEMGIDVLLTDREITVVDTASFELPKPDSIRYVDEDGSVMYLMRNEKDENGLESVHDVLQASYVTATFKNVAERHGKVDLEFKVVVPAKMQDSKWQVRFCPDLYVLEDSIRLDPVIITGKEYRKAQLKGYQHYEKFVDSIISDTTKFVNVDQLEIFLRRYIPEIYAFKTDSTEVSDEKFASAYGVTARDALEHYTNRAAKARNERRKARMQKMYAKYVKAPIVTEGIRLDTVIVSSDGDFEYNYVQTINARPKLKKAYVALTGEVYEQGKMIYETPQSKKIEFIISSVSDLIDEESLNSKRFVRRMVERQVGVNAKCNIVFAAGKAELDLSMGRNAEELAKVRGYVTDVLSNGSFTLDSLVVTSSASPDGSYAINTKVSRLRAENLKRHIDRMARELSDSLVRAGGFSVDEQGSISKYQAPRRMIVLSRSLSENWGLLDELVSRDSTISAAEREIYFSCSSAPDPDQRERRMAAEMKSFRYVKDRLYPKLRNVTFSFHLKSTARKREFVDTEEIDTLYATGVRAIQDRDYEKAASILAPYADYNTAVAYLALDRNISAQAVLSSLEPNADVNYLLAIAYSRLGDDQKAVQCYLDACREDHSKVFRGNKDPEISVLIRRYGLNSQDDGQF